MILSSGLFIKRILPLLFISSLFGSCYYDNQDELHPGIETTVCDTTGIVSYASDIVPILNTYCSLNSSSCHSSGSSFPMDTYNDVFTLATAGHGCGGTGVLVPAIKHDVCLDPVDFMPSGGGFINSCSIEKIEAWVNRGALNN